LKILGIFEDALLFICQGSYGLKPQRKYIITNLSSRQDLFLIFLRLFLSRKKSTTFYAVDLIYHDLCPLSTLKIKVFKGFFDPQDNVDLKLFSFYILEIMPRGQLKQVS
jgi:hypothetical protein